MFIEICGDEDVAASGAACGRSGSERLKTIGIITVYVAILPATCKQRKNEKKKKVFSLSLINKQI